MSNLTCDGNGNLGFAFSEPAWSTPIPPLAGPSLVVQSLPSASTVAFLFLLEAVARGPVAWGFRLLAGCVSLLAGTALSLLAWRGFSLLGCEGRSSDSDWKVPALLAAAASSVSLLFLAVRCAPRLASLLSLAAASSSVVADWALRDGKWGEPTRAADLLVAVQVLWCVQAVSLAMLVRRRRKRRGGKTRLVYRLPRWTGKAATGASSAPALHSSSSVDLVVDSLARRPGSKGGTNAAEEELRREVGRSWFW